MNIQSDHLKLQFDKTHAQYSLHSLDSDGVSLSGKVEAAVTLKYHRGRGLQTLVLSIGEVVENNVSSPIGEAQISAFSYQTQLPGVSLIVRIGLAADQPFMLIQLEVSNQSDLPLAVEQLTPVDITSGALHLGIENTPKPVFYSNGWQSWSSTGAYSLGDRQRTSILGPFQSPMVFNPGTPKPKRRNHFSGDMFGVIGDQDSRIGLLAGFLSQEQHFGSLETHFNPSPSLKMWAIGDHTCLEPGGSMKTDWAVLNFIALDATDPLHNYLQAVADLYQIDTNRPIPTGWCSWYYFYQNISQENIEANLKTIKEWQHKLPLDLFQIDDGFEPYPGDWFDFVPEFPDGLLPIVEKTNQAELTPGVWLAPFIVHPKAQLVKDHTDWLLRDRKGKPVNAGFVWNAFTYALDLTHPQALNYACEVIQTAIEEWGFRYLKLDFLYAAALDGIHRDPTLTRAQILRKGLSALRQAAGPDVTLLACGCPIGSALGLFDAMRIGADVSGHWKPHFPPVSPLLHKETHMPSARNALQNILSRTMLHRRWWINDPDCLLIRPDSDLTLAEVHTLATAISLTGGSLLLSDDLPALPQERLQIAQALLPLIGLRARVMDWIDANTPNRLRLDMDGAPGDWHLLACFNWADEPNTLAFSPQAFDLDPEMDWWIREFWSGETGMMRAETAYTFHNVPPHGVRVIAARPYQAETPAYLGGDLHLSQGVEIRTWHVADQTVSFTLDLDREVSGNIYLYLPWVPKGAKANGTPCPINPVRDSVYAVHLPPAAGHSIQVAK